MKILCTRVVMAAAAIQLFAISASNAQSPKSTTIPSLSAPPASVVVDGDAKEWGDTLRYYDKENKISYTLANDKDNLYMIMRIKDRVQQIRAIKAGVTFSIDTRGKKRNSYSITFPVNLSAYSSDFNFHSVNSGPVNQKDRDQLTRDRSYSLKGIKVDGFKDFESGMLSTTDNHGILADINYDAQGNLVCEAVIPLKNFHVDDLTKNEWAFNFQVNAISKPTPPAEASTTESSGRGSSRGGSASSSSRGVGRPGTGTTTDGPDAGPSNYYRSDDFWVKFFLAK
jgi:hypothetical protein